MNNPRDIAEVIQFPWFSRCWSRNRKTNLPFPPSNQTTLDKYFPKLQSSPIQTAIGAKADKIVIPLFRSIRYVQKDEFCDIMSNWAWEACHCPDGEAGQVSHLFYLNSFDIFDDPIFLDEISWGSHSSCLPSDLIKCEIYRLLQGIPFYSQFFRMARINSDLLDFLRITMTHRLPSEKHYSERLKQITVSKVSDFFHQLISEARSLGLIRDTVHIWDGQFHKTWLQKNKPRKTGLEQFYGGTYNHGGAKVGIGVYQSTIMDWNGVCTIPIHTDVFPANKNENPALRISVSKAYRTLNPAPKYFFADRGPSGKKTRNTIMGLGSIPIIPLTENSTRDIRITQNKGHRFCQSYFEFTDDITLERAYNMRTRIEEHFSLQDHVFGMGWIHGTGEEMTQITVLLGCCLGVLIPLTAYKIGRPDLMWSPTAFQEQSVYPEYIFPEAYRQWDGFRWDDEISMSPSKYLKKKREDPDYRPVFSRI